MPELLSPAGNFEKLKAAIRYGADAVYCAGQAFGMRAAAGNFTLDELAEAAEYVHARGRRMHITVNVMARDADYPRLREYLGALREVKPDALIVADLGVMAEVRRILPDGMSALQHDTADIGQAVVCGTRGWAYPNAETPLSPEDERIFNREMIRLELALQSAVKIAGERPIVVMLHYPPLYNLDKDTPFTRVLEKYPVHTVVYGHLHGAGIRAGFTGEWQGIRYLLASCDSLGFALAEVPIGK